MLAARLSTHPDIDAPSVKEPNYFSRHYAEGPKWYDDFFPARSPGRYRLDASVSYTYPQHPEALARIAADAPDASIVYVVREPVQRAVSHYLFYRYYFQRDPAPDFGSAIRRDPYYLEVSDYEHWLGRLAGVFPRDRTLVVPFAAVTESSQDVAAVICRRLGLQPPPAVDHEVDIHQNNTVSFRSDRVRRMTRAMRHSSVYPRLRRAIGPYTMRRIRSAVTTTPQMPTAQEALASCDADQLATLRDLRDRADSAVTAWLVEQDAASGLQWSSHWSRTGPSVDPA